MLLRQGTASAGPPGAKKCGAVESVSQPKVPLESGIASRNLAAERRKNAAHGASRGWKVENDRAPEERKKGCDTDSLAPEGRTSLSPKSFMRPVLVNLRLIPAQ